MFTNHIKSAEFKKIVSKEIGPFLRAQGWKGSGFKYRRNKYGVQNEILFQGSSAGRKFCINLNSSLELNQPLENELINGENTWNFSNRLTPDDSSDYWWEFPGRNGAYDELIEELKGLIEGKVDLHFSKWDNWQDQISTIKPNDLNSGIAGKLFYGTTEFSRLILCAIHHIYLGNKERTTEFANLAKAKIKGGRGSGRLPLLNEIISVANN